MPIEGSKRKRGAIDFRWGKGTDRDPRHYAYACTGDALEGLQDMPASKLGKQLIALLAEYQQHLPERARADRLAASALPLRDQLPDIADAGGYACFYAIETIDACTRAIVSEAEGNRDDAWRSVLDAVDSSQMLSNIANNSRDQSRAARAKYSNDSATDIRRAVYELWLKQRRGDSPTVPTDVAFIDAVCDESPELNHSTVAKWITRWKSDAVRHDSWPLFDSESAPFSN